MALTPDLVARVHRVMEDPGPEPGPSYQSDQDYDALVTALMRSRPVTPETWLCAYGSLISKPEIEHVESRKGTAAFAAPRTSQADDVARPGWPAVLTHRTGIDPCE
jgi:hypothetical protein